MLFTCTRRIIDMMFKREIKPLQPLPPIKQTRDKRGRFLRCNKYIIRANMMRDGL